MSDWPYDADRDDPLTALRIPVTSAYPGWRYTATFDRESEVRPTALEALQLASFIEEYREYWFNETYKAKLSQRPFDTDAVTRVFHKWADGDWSYRVVTWEYGPFWVPVFPNLRGTDLDDRPNWVAPMTLVQVMDRVHTIDDGPMTHWVEWKAAHPDVFGESASGRAAEQGDSDQPDISGGPCCERANELSSHYHCGTCGEVTGMMGHFVGGQNGRVICDPDERSAFLRSLDAPDADPLRQDPDINAEYRAEQHDGHDPIGRAS